MAKIFPGYALDMPKIHPKSDLRVIVGNKIWVVLLDAIVKDCNNNALASDAHLPSFLHAHVQLAATV